MLSMSVDFLLYPKCFCSRFRHAPVSCVQRCYYIGQIKITNTLHDFCTRRTGGALIVMRCKRAEHASKLLALCHEIKFDFEWRDWRHAIDLCQYLYRQFP